MSDLNAAKIGPHAVQVEAAAKSAWSDACETWPHLKTFERGEELFIMGFALGTNWAAGYIPKITGERS